MLDTKVMTKPQIDFQFEVRCHIEGVNRLI